MTGLAFLVFGSVAIVDRIEGPVAVLEWRDLSLSEVPVEILPVDVSEGDRVVFRARTPPRTPAARSPGSRTRGAARERLRAAE